MTTSGTTSQTVFRTQAVLDSAFRRAGILPEKISGELIETANNILFTRLSSLPNRLIPLWTIQSIILAMYEGEQTVLTPVGVADVLNANLRTLQRFTVGDNGTLDPGQSVGIFGTATASEGVADNAFDSVITTACTQTTPDGWIQLELTGATRASNYGVLPNSDGNLTGGLWDFAIQGSNDDGATWTDIYSVTGQLVQEQVWLWFDVEGANQYEIFRIKASGGSILDVAELVFANTPNEVPIALINRDDYYNLPDKSFLGRPTQYWLDKQRDQLKMMIWPSPQTQFTFSQITCQAQYYIQDVGSMVQMLDIPQRWFDFACWDLAQGLVFEAPEADLNREPRISAMRDKAYQDAAAGESDRAPSMITPRIRVYTR